MFGRGRDCLLLGSVDCCDSAMNYVHCRTQEDSAYIDLATGTGSPHLPEMRKVPRNRAACCPVLYTWRKIGKTMGDMFEDVDEGKKRMQKVGYGGDTRLG